MADTSGFFDDEEARLHAKARAEWSVAERAAIRALRQTSRAALEPIQHQAGSPIYHGYRVAIPAGWRAQAAVLYQVAETPDEPEQPGVPAALLKGFQKFRAGVLLCPLEADGRAAAQEFQGGVLLEAAFLGQDGQYLQAAQKRPAYAVIPLEASNPTRADAFGLSECLVLLPLFDFPLGVPRESLPPIMMFVNGVCVYRTDAVWGAV